MKVKLVEKKQEASDCISFIFEPEQAFEWQAGQYLRYTIPNPNPDDRSIQRYFTISAAPFEKHIMLTTRFAGEKGSSFKKDLHDLEIGAEIEVEGPMGNFIISDPNAHYIFLAGGIGITPFRSILLELEHNNLPINVSLFYANRNDEIVFKEIFDNLATANPGFKVKYIIEPERIDGEFLKHNIADLNSPFYYISGPKPMVEGVEKTLTELGVAEEKLKHDYFPGYTGI